MRTIKVDLSLGPRSDVNPFVQWFINTIAYMLVLITVSVYLREFYIESMLVALIAGVIISLLNMTVKPLLLVLTFPITIITFGLFIPVINVIILWLTSFVLKGKFVIGDFYTALLIAVLLSIIKFLVDKLILDKIYERFGDKNGKNS